MQRRAVVALLSLAVLAGIGVVLWNRGDDPILSDLQRWDAAPADVRKAAVERVARRLGDFDLVQWITFTCGGQSHEVAVFRHKATDLEFVLVPGGVLRVGLHGDERSLGYERDLHAITIKPFLIARTETTQSAWSKVTSAPDPSRIKGASHPVDGVSWDDAKLFCDKTDTTLPTEAQWEWACRAGTATRWFFGDEEKQFGDYAWYPTRDRRAHPVGEKRPNAFGLFDMQGYMWEWCEDAWHEDFRDAPSDGAAWIDPESSHRVHPLRVRRGGTFGFAPERDYLPDRFCGVPSSGWTLGGFRLARSVSR